MASNGILQKSTVQIASLIRNGAISKDVVARECYKRIEEIKPLNAFITVVDDHTNKNHGSTDLPLHGVPFAVKDNFSTVGVRTTCASNMLKDYVPTFNATVVDRLLKAGAVMMGKTNMDEFAMGSGSVNSLFGPVRSPWLYDFNNTDNSDWFICGGSSGGSAVAVATGASYLSLKFIIQHPVWEALEFYYDPRPYRKILQNLAETLVFEYNVPGMSPEVIEAWNRTADIFENAGARVVQVSLPHTEYSIPCYQVLGAAEVASNMARFDGLEFGHRVEGDYTEKMYARSRSEGFNETVAGRILAGNYFLLKSNYEKYYEKAMKVRRLITDDFLNIFSTKENLRVGGRPQTMGMSNSSVDILLTPAMVSPSPLYSEFNQRSNRHRTVEHDVCLQPVNLAGVPAISVPVNLSQNGLPISMQLISAHFNDSTLLSTAKFLEQSVSFPCFKFPDII
uniref:glutamyl-tRNA(Gln) amidotransferase subunit A, mitochondrial-like n=1 Tax=Ciona intestinalis TaxID=7719 RepID=UPI0002B8E0D2|nr:glutamyl-tRNA(Gln) amidotransferase subunit A, mitochondrial-like [Ciona intestinalis]|eukprot:XP_002129795.2 glutamyl-tRNA(Gln) amidotransferase subunit A, mitochondrial-like [Ciona intestinalis]